MRKILQGKDMESLLNDVLGVFWRHGRTLADVTLPKKDYGSFVSWMKQYPHQKWGKCIESDFGVFRVRRGNAKSSITFRWE